MSEMMNGCRAGVLALGVVLLSAGSAFAQFQQDPPCLKDFIPIRDDAAKKAAAIKTASDRHASPAEACKLFNVFAAAEEKVLKYATANATWCGIPPEAVAQMKTNHGQTLQLRSRVCQAAAQANTGAPRGPSLSDAFGAPTAAAPGNTKRGNGTFDTLTGSPLAR